MEIQWQIKYNLWSLQNLFLLFCKRVGSEITVAMLLPASQTSNHDIDYYSTENERVSAIVYIWKKRGKDRETGRRKVDLHLEKEVNLLPHLPLCKTLKHLKRG